MAARNTETHKKEPQLPNNNLSLPNLFLTLKKKKKNFYKYAGVYREKKKRR